MFEFVVYIDSSMVLLFFGSVFLGSAVLGSADLWFCISMILYFYDSVIVWFCSSTVL